MLAGGDEKPGMARARCQELIGIGRRWGMHQPERAAPLFEDAWDRAAALRTAGERRAIYRDLVAAMAATGQPALVKQALVRAHAHPAALLDSFGPVVTAVVALSGAPERVLEEQALAEERVV